MAGKEISKGYTEPEIRRAWVLLLTQQNQERAKFLQNIGSEKEELRDQILHAYSVMHIAMDACLDLSETSRYVRQFNQKTLRIERNDC